MLPVCENQHYHTATAHSSDTQNTESVIYLTEQSRLYEVRVG